LSLPHAERTAATNCFDVEITTGSRPDLWRWRFKRLDNRYLPAVDPPGTSDPSTAWLEPQTELAPWAIAEALIELHCEIGKPDEFNVYFVEAPAHVIAEIFRVSGQSPQSVRN
jgi:hypothetical protein